MKMLMPPAGAGMDGNNDVLNNFENIRSKYLAQSDPGAGSSGAQAVPTNGHFYRNSTDYNVLTQRVAGFDKLFYSLINGMVEDPDFALRKDPQIYARMLRDPQIYYCLLVRKTATACLPWVVTPPDEFSEDPTAMQLADAASNRIKRIPQFRQFLDSLLDALLPGMAINELMWRVDDDGQYVVGQHLPENKDRFKYNKFKELCLLSPRSPITGEPVPHYKFITHHFKIRGASWNRPEESGYSFYGQGLADTPLYHYFYFKVTALRFMLKNLERNSSPFKVYYTGPQNATLAAKLDSILVALQNDSVVGIPGKKGETNVDVEAAKGGADLYIAVIEYVDRLITRAILGQDLMTEMPAVGSYAAAQVHASVFAKIAEQDRDLLQDTLNHTLMRYDAELNTPGVPQHLRPVFKFKPAAVLDAGQLLQNAQLALNLGLTLSENQIRDLTGFREPGMNEKPLDASFMMQQQMMMQENQTNNDMKKDSNKIKEQGRAEGAAQASSNAKKSQKKAAKKTAQKASSK